MSQDFTLYIVTYLNSLNETCKAMFTDKESANWFRSGAEAGMPSPIKDIISCGIQDVAISVLNNEKYGI